VVIVNGKCLGTIIIVLGIAGIAAWTSASSASPDSGAALTSVKLLAAGPAAEGEEHAYVGSKKCKMCHRDEYKSWEEGKKAKTFDILMPGQAAEAKTKAGLDPEKDYTKDESCLKCHTTGYGKKGGYQIPDPADEKAVKEAKALQGVGCECCHGPGSAYLDFHKELMKSKRTYKDEEMYAAGMAKITKEHCVDCHNEKSPTYDPDNPFDFEKMKGKGGHEHFPLKQREE
jgi:formate-dependent nitrite reductase cytochrome c552 subunit